MLDRCDSYYLCGTGQNFPLGKHRRRCGTDVIHTTSVALAKTCPQKNIDDVGSMWFILPPCTWPKTGARSDSHPGLRDWNPKPKGCWGKKRKENEKRKLRKKTLTMLDRCDSYYLCGTGQNLPLEKHRRCCTDVTHTTSVALAKICP